jgi:hypothetical protein
MDYAFLGVGTDGNRSLRRRSRRKAVMRLLELLVDEGGADVSWWTQAWRSSARTGRGS